jgi:protocatechuate 3,4-dioxygenase beta subunit
MAFSTRRSVLKAFGALAVSRCGEPAARLEVNADGGAGGSGGFDGGAGGTGGEASGGAGGSRVTPSSYAVGSGAFLSGKRYSNPFASGIGAACSVYPASTEGPCHSNTFFRQDISDGLVGLPTRFELLVVDRSCMPVSNAIVEVWFSSPAGTYSKAAEAIDAGTGYGGALSDFNAGFCTGNDAVALASNWLRGYQKAGSNGRVTIDGIFPGWYSGRTPHVHFAVTANGQRHVTSQLFFAEELTTGIYTRHGAYAARGDKDTGNANDGVVRQAGLDLNSALMSSAQQSDGALVVWKAITVAA